MSETPERWRIIEELYRSALEREPDRRGEFLKEACQDEELRREVESLLRCAPIGDLLLDRPPLHNAFRPLQAGSTLVQYRIVELLGSGAMGEVYRATDAKLGRDVAIKVLPQAFARDPERLLRFEREARMLASLNHPGIAAIYGFEQSGGIHFLALELVPGHTLADRIARGPLAIQDAVQIAAQIAEALEAAHQKGIIHRDLKPGNIMLGEASSGQFAIQAKLLDFGVAKLAEPAEARAADPTTEAGSIIGTASYMSPEQAQGLKVDARSDVFSLGAVLYEMLTGQRAFPGPTIAATIYAVAHAEPRPIHELRPDAPKQISRIVERALAKDPHARFQSAAEMAAALRSPATYRAATVMERSLRKQALLASAGVLMTILLLAFGLNMAGIRDRLRSQGAQTPIQSLAVLPLENLSADPAQDYFADGMTDELITEIARMGSLRVISRTSVMQYKARHKPLPMIARELGVDAVLEGTVVRSGQKVRITARLIQARDDRRLWSEKYERDLGDVLKLQAEVAQAIASQIRLNQTPQERAILGRARPVNPQAYEAYLQGTFFLHKGSPDGVNKSIEFFTQAIALDPGYARGYAGLSHSYYVSGIRGFRPAGEAYPEAERAARQALKLDETIEEAHNTLAEVKKGYDWDWAGAEAEYKRILELNPNDPTAHGGYADYLSKMGRHDEAVAEAKRARELEPISVPANSSLGFILYRARRYDEAIVACRKALEFDPNHPVALWFLALALEQKREFPEATAKLEKAVSLSGDPMLRAALGYAYGVAGKTSEASGVLEELYALSRKRYVSPLDIAIVYTGLGDKNSAFQWLEKAYQERTMRIQELPQPHFDSLRSDSRFQDLLRRIGLPL